MLELRTPIGGQFAAAAAHEGAAADPSAVKISAAPPGALVQLAGWETFAEAAEPALRILGLSGLGGYKTARIADGSICYRLAHDRILLRSNNTVQLVRATSVLPSTTVSFLDLSHSRWVLQFEGARAPSLLARLAPLDFSLAGFPVESFAQTAIDHVGVLIHRRTVECFEVLVPYTWMDSIWRMSAANLPPKNST
jgi:heterotetrameric sarcosine oxidase gamma subunit